MDEDDPAQELFDYFDHQIAERGTEACKAEWYRAAVSDLRRLGPAAYHEMLCSVFRGGIAEAVVKASRDQFITRATFDPLGAFTALMDDVARAGLPRQ